MWNRTGLRAVRDPDGRGRGSSCWHLWFYYCCGNVPEAPLPELLGRSPSCNSKCEQRVGSRCQAAERAWLEAGLAYCLCECWYIWR
jgi:hypothetical protein